MHKPTKTAKVCPKTKLSPIIKLRIKREISNLQSSDEKLILQKLYNE